MLGTDPDLAGQVAAAMDCLGPFEPRPALAVAVSGGADSMALAVLVRDWARRLGGSVIALVVDHGLRPASADEARITIERLATLDIPARLLPLHDLKHGGALAERARTMRYQALTRACREAGILHLLLGHHAADQVETLMMRVLRGSQTHGLACMSAVLEANQCRLLRPLLRIEPALLRQYLTAHGVAWVEDPSNRDARALRPRLRHHIVTMTPAKPGLTEAISVVAELRAREEAQTAAELARRVSIRPEGFALLSPGRIGAAALRSVIRTIGGAAYPPSPARISDLAARPRPATVAGVRIMAAGRLSDGWLLVREEAAIADPIPALSDTVWDHRFRLMARKTLPNGASIGKLGPDATRFRAGSPLPSTVLRTLPAIRLGKVLAAVPHLGYASVEYDMRMTVLFSPRTPIAGPCFVPAQ